MPLRRRPMPVRRVTATLAALSVAAAGAAVLGGAPSQAAPRQVVTDYGFEGTAYGTTVRSENAGLRSGRSAYAYVTCTRKINRTDAETLASLSLPSDAPTIQVDGLSSSNRSFRDRADNIDAAITSVNKISRVRLGSADTPRLVMEGLKTRSTAWATTRGRLRAVNDVTAARLRLVNLESSPVDGTPLGDLADAFNGGIDEVLTTLAGSGQPTEIPGLGTISAGYDRRVTRDGFAVAGSLLFRVHLYGPDQVSGGDDDSFVGIGHSRSRIDTGLISGVMYGEGWGADAEVVDGVVRAGHLGEHPLPCPGTGGEVRRATTARLDFASAGQLVANGVSSKVWGQQFASGRAEAWTQGEVADLQLGPLEIRAIRGRAAVTQNARGEITKRSIASSRIGEILVDGESQGALRPGDLADAPELEIPGVTSIDFFVTERTARGLRTSAVVITFAEDTPGVSKLRLGNAVAAIRRS